MPAITSAAEITRDGSESFCEKLSSIDFAPPVGTKRSPICTPFGRTITGPVHAAVLHHRRERQRREELPVRHLDDQRDAPVDAVARIGVHLDVRQRVAAAEVQRRVAMSVAVDRIGWSAAVDGLQRRLASPSTTLPASSIAGVEGSRRPPVSLVA